MSSIKDVVMYFVACDTLALGATMYGILALSPISLSSFLPLPGNRVVPIYDSILAALIGNLVSYKIAESVCLALGM